jgi:hypothetical protein
MLSQFFLEKSGVICLIVKRQSAVHDCIFFSNFLLTCDSPGIMLLIYTRTSSSVPLKILSIEDGTVLKSFSHLLHRNKKVDFIEQFNEKLLVKQEGENLQILDVCIHFTFSQKYSLSL